ncbi:MAG TPA: hypothetical protein VKO20_04725 [Desulfosalsimonadaceae bacterium]|nr:hypothetical protein [Desulfosalsimonadaceae bacterium]
MTIEFRKQDKKARFLNPFTNFSPSEVTCQIRWDPLTKRSGRLAHFLGTSLPPADLSAIIEGSEKNCPFCPQSVHERTPTFEAGRIPEGRLIKGESVLFPNLLPYDEHSAIAVLCEKHHRSLDEFPAWIFEDAHANCLAYLQRVVADKTTYALVTWNYMPAAGSSQVHPHFQVYATKTPGNFLQSMLTAEKDYYQTNNRSYWEDYLGAETGSGERLITEAKHSIWLTDFVPLSALSDIIAVFPNRQTLFDLNENELAETSRMLGSMLQYLGSYGVYSLNMAWLPAVPEQKEHWLQLRISPRLYLAPHVWCTETPSLVYQYQESFSIWSPEETAKELREFLQQPQNP